MNATSSLAVEQCLLSLYNPRPHLLNLTQQLSSKPDEAQKASLPIQDLHLCNLPQTRSVRRLPGLLTAIRAGTILRVVIAADLLQFINNYRHASMYDARVTLFLPVDGSSSSASYQGHWRIRLPDDHWARLTRY